MKLEVTLGGVAALEDALYKNQNPPARERALYRISIQTPIFLMRTCRYQPNIIIPIVPRVDFYCLKGFLMEKEHLLFSTQLLVSTSMDHDTYLSAVATVYGLNQFKH